MAPRKKADEKSTQLAAAAVGAGTEPVSAQAEPKKDGVLVDPDAEAARLEAEQQAAEAAAVAATTQDATAGDPVITIANYEAAVASEPGANLAEELDISNAALVMGVDDGQPDWLLGQFDVKAKSPAGFWRCQVHFLHSSPTRVFVVENKANVPHDHDCEIPCCYLTREEAKRVYGDPWLKVLIDSEVIKD